MFSNQPCGSGSSLLTVIRVKSSRAQSDTGACFLVVVESAPAGCAEVLAPAKAGLAAPVAPAAPPLRTVPKVAGRTGVHALPGKAATILQLTGGQKRRYPGASNAGAFAQPLALLGWSQCCTTLGSTHRTCPEDPPHVPPPTRTLAWHLTVSHPRLRCSPLGCRASSTPGPLGLPWLLPGCPPDLGAALATPWDPALPSWRTGGCPAWGVCVCG